ncbi:J domain-containing protein [Lysobacter hankyongensis]|uniref:J domain-containing protein n=1 Tax=Lysobacter hankyongensis TaxID=1176535 RepID=A0ABP9C6R0_9GAMM
MHWALDTLGVGPDADERAIKRAYAAKLKTTRPEEDPQGFQALNEAYRAALAWCADVRTRSTDADIAAKPGEAKDEAPSDEETSRATRDAAAAPPSDPDAGTPSGSNAQPVPGYRARTQMRDVARDAADLDALLEDCLRAAYDEDPGMLRAWVTEHPALWSLQRKRQIGEHLLGLLDARRPPVPERNFDALAEHFGYDDLHNAIDPLALRALRADLDGIWHGERLRFRSHGSRPSAPPWSAEASRQRMLGQESAQQRETSALETQQNETRRQRERWLLDGANREHRQLLDPPNLLRDLQRMLKPGYATTLSNFLIEMGCDDPDNIPQGLRADQVRFWTAAGNREVWSLPRLKLALVRFGAALLVVCIVLALAELLGAFDG